MLRRSQARHTFTSSITSCALTSTTLTVTDLTHLQLQPRLTLPAVFFVFPCCEAPSGHRRYHVIFDALVNIPESLCQFIKVPRVCARLARCGRGTCSSQTLVSSATLTETFPSWSLPMLSHQDGRHRGVFEKTLRDRLLQSEHFLAYKETECRSQP